MGFLKAPSLKSWLQQGGFPLGLLSEGLCQTRRQLLAVVGNPRCSRACGRVTPISASAITWCPPCPCVQISSSHKGISHRIRGHPSPIEPHFNSSPAAKALFSNKVTLRRMGAVRTSAPAWERHNPAHNKRRGAQRKARDTEGPGCCLPPVAGAAIWGA